MKEQVILNIKGYNVRVEIEFAAKTSRTYHLAFGIIYCKYKFGTALEEIKSDLEKLYSAKRLALLNSEPFFDESYCYLLGEKKLYKLRSEELKMENILIEYKGKEMTLEEILFDVLKEEVNYYQKLFNLPSHIIKIKSSVSYLAINYVNRKTIIFNRNLIFFSLEQIRRVVIHELTHDKYRNHGDKFYQFVLKYFPNYYQEQDKTMRGIYK